MLASIIKFRLMFAFKLMKNFLDKLLHFIDKESNPSNVNQAIPIENFWECSIQKNDGEWRVTQMTTNIKRIDLPH